MRICIDVRCLTEGRRTGVEEYVLGLLPELFRLDQENEYVLFYSSWKEPLFDFAFFDQYPRVTVKKLRLSNKLLNLAFWYLGWPKIDRLVGGADAVFLPNLIFGAVSRKVRLVTTIHDLSFERYPHCFSWKRRLWHVFVNPKKLCRRSDRIIAVSASSAADVAQLYGVDRKKIKAIPSAIDQRFRLLDRNDAKLIEVKEKYHLPFKFILYLGTIEPRKNIIGLIRAFERFQRSAETQGAEELAKYKLVIAGSPGWLGEQVFAELGKSAYQEKIIFTGFVSDPDKVCFYNLASLFVYPSFFEGFGFPPLEAMSCGVPVITANGSSLSEICGDAAILIDPDKPEEIARAMREALSDKSLREKLAGRGLEKAKTYDWSRTALQTLEVLENKKAA